MPPRDRTWSTPPELWEKLKPAAQRLRLERTPTESALWKERRGRRLAGLAFRRQHPISRFVVDFYCPESRVVVEIDGGVHEGRETEDAMPQRELERLGMKVIRFANERVRDSLEEVLSRILAACGHEVRNPAERKSADVPESRTSRRSRS